MVRLNWAIKICVPLLGIVCLKLKINFGLYDSWLSDFGVGYFLDNMLVQHANQDIDMC